MATSGSAKRRRPTPPKRKGPSKAELVRQYERHVGVTPSPRSTKVWLSTQTDAARSAAGANRRAAGIQAVALATTAVGTYRRVRNEQKSDPSKQSMAGVNADRLKAAGSAAVAVAPGAALTFVQGRANALAHGFYHFSLGLSLPKAITAPAAAVTKATGRAVLPALAGWQMHKGAMEDHESALRGAGRGLTRAIDPSAIIMGRGLLERGYDKLAGTPKEPPKPGFWDSPNDPKFQRQPNSYEKFVRGVKESVLSRVLKTSAATPVGPQYAEVKPEKVQTWTDSRGWVYHRQT